MAVQTVFTRPRRRDRVLAAAIVGALATAVLAGQQADLAAVSPGPTPNLTDAIASADASHIDPTFGTGGSFLATTVYADSLTWMQAGWCALKPDCDVYPLSTSTDALADAQSQMAQSLHTASALADARTANLTTYDPAALDDLGDVQGPSAGLMLTLALLDARTDGDLTSGLTVAGTGTVTATGTVGPIGGIEHKVAGATAAGATVFFAPAEQAQDAAEAAELGIQVVPVRTVDDAVAWLCTHGGISQLCT